MYKVGYKAFNEDMTNRYGEQALVQNFLKCDYIKYQESGIHFCENLEDTLRFYDGFSDISICMVLAIGDIVEYFDEHNEYYTYATTNLYICKKLSRDEIIEYAKKLNYERLNRFLKGYKLTEEELAYILEGKDFRCLLYADYYQRGKTDVFNKKEKKLSRHE